MRKLLLPPYGINVRRANHIAFALTLVFKDLLINSGVTHFRLGLKRAKCILTNKTF